MLQLKNSTGFAASLMLLPDTDAVDTIFAVVKGTFSLQGLLGGEAMPVAEEQVPIALADKYYGDVTTSSIRVPSDVCLGKVATDVLLVGSAWAPGGQPTWQMDVHLAVGPIAKSVRVSADRVWETGAGGTTMKWVTPFLRMPLMWERAFGGSDETQKGLAADRRNPVGAGFRASSGSKQLSGLALPNVEDPAAPVSTPGDRPTPAGFAPLAPHWEPRSSYAGTYDSAWQAGRAPYLPTDFDRRFFQLAPQGLVAPTFLRGGETVTAHGVSPGGPLEFALPIAAVDVSYLVDETEIGRPAVLDTVILEPDEGRVMLVWRASLPCDKKALSVREVRVGVGS
jgi:hypothetical protein